MGNYAGFAHLGTGANGDECHGSQVYDVDSGKIEGTFDIFWSRSMNVPKYAKITSVELRCLAKKVKTSISMPGTVRWGWNKMMYGKDSWNGTSADASQFNDFYTTQTTLDSVGQNYPSSPYSYMLSNYKAFSWEHLYNGFMLRLGTYNPTAIGTYRAYVQYDNITLIAQWDDPTIEVKVSAGTGGTVSINDTSKISFPYRGRTGSRTITATASAGYEFVSWNDGNTNATRTITFSENDLTAFATSKTYTATFKATTTGTNKIYVGNNKIQSIYLGNTPVKAVYVGNTKVYEQ